MKRDVKIGYAETMPAFGRKWTSTCTKGFEHCLKLIGAGQVECKEPWSWTEADRQKCLGEKGDDWDMYGKCHLGEDQSKPEETRARYAAPCVKDGKCSKAALITIGTSDDDGEAPVARSARRLLKHIGMDEDETKAAGFDVYRAGIEVCEEASRHAEQLIAGGRVSLSGEWKFTEADGRKALGDGNWRQYAAAHLGEDWGVLDRERGRWGYPFVKDGRVSREALVQAAVKAAQAGDTDIAAEARRLVALVDCTENERKGLDPELRAVAVNAAARVHVASLLAAGKVDKTSTWQFTSADGDRLLGARQDNWQEFARWHLGVDTAKSADGRGKWKYPLGKEGRVYRSAVDAAALRATAEGDKTVAAQAYTLLALIDRS